MPKLVTSDTQVRDIALAFNPRGKSSRLDFLSPHFVTLEVGARLILDDDDVRKYDPALVAIIAACGDGVILSKEQRAKMRNFLAALIRGIRKEHGDKADLHAAYVAVPAASNFDDDGEFIGETDDDGEPVIVWVPAYAVDRVA